MSDRTTVRRPFGVSLVMVLTYLSGVLGVIGGIVLVLARNDVQVERELRASSTTLLYAGILTLVIGVVTLLVAGGLRRGSNGARLLVSFLMALQVLGGIWTVLQVPWQRANGLGNLLVAILVLLLLWTGAANRFFGRR